MERILSSLHHYAAYAIPVAARILSLRCWAAKDGGGAIASAFAERGHEQTSLRRLGGSVTKGR